MKFPFTQSELKIAHDGLRDRMNRSINYLVKPADIDIVREYVVFCLDNGLSYDQEEILAAIRARIAELYSSASFAVMRDIQKKYFECVDLLATLTPPPVKSTPEFDPEIVYFVIYSGGDQPSEGDYAWLTQFAEFGGWDGSVFVESMMRGEGVAILGKALNALGFTRNQPHFSVNELWLTFIED